MSQAQDPWWRGPAVGSDSPRSSPPPRRPQWRWRHRAPLRRCRCSAPSARPGSTWDPPCSRPAHATSTDGPWMTMGWLEIMRFNWYKHDTNMLHINTSFESKWNPAKQIQVNLWVHARESSNRERSTLVIVNWPSLAEEQTMAMTWKIWKLYGDPWFNMVQVYPAFQQSKDWGH